jgi:glycosyltransferase involved in cell wall biosynthesis
MKVLILSDAASSHTRKWVKGLNRRGIEISVFSLTPNSDDFYAELNVTLTALNYNATTGRVAHKLLYLKSLPTIRKLITSFQPDIVHAHYASSYGLLGALCVKTTYCISVWGSDVYSYPKSGNLYEKLLKHTLSRADMVFSTSEDMRKETAQYTDRKICVIPFGIDMNLYPDPPDIGVEDDTIRFASAKSFKAIYNIPILISAFLKLLTLFPERKIRLDLAGQGPERELCEKLARVELNKSIFFHGLIAPEKMPDFFKGKHVLVNIPQTESFGVSILEASASGMAVIATKAGGIPEVVLDGKTGWLLEEINEDSVCDAMAGFVKNPGLISRFGTEGRRFVKKNYDFEICLDRQVSEYKKLYED